MGLLMFTEALSRAVVCSSDSPEGDVPFAAGDNRRLLHVDATVLVLQDALPVFELLNGVEEEIAGRVVFMEFLHALKTRAEDRTRD